MKFLSRNSNLLVVLKPGIPASNITGTPAVYGVYAKFVDGVVEIKEKEHIKLMLAHPGCGQDFKPVEENEKDPYAYFREESEPAHTITEIKYGHAEKSYSTAKPIKIPPELEKLINSRAVEIAREMLPGMVKEVIKEFGVDKVVGAASPESAANPSSSEESPKVEAPPEVGATPRRGRPPKKLVDETKAPAPVEQKQV